MRFVEFTNTDGAIVVVHPNNVESLRANTSDYADGPYTNIRFSSGQLEIVKGSLGNTVEKLNYGDQYNE